MSIKHYNSKNLFLQDIITVNSLKFLYISNLILSPFSLCACYSNSMLLALLLILIILWLLGYIPVAIFAIPNLVLFSINNHPISLWNLIVFAIILAIIGVLPRPFREIASVLLILWILSLLGIFFIAGFSNIIVLAIIIGVIVLLFTGIS